MKRLALLAAVATLGLTACETATPYQPLGLHGHASSGGYSDQQIEANRWSVSFAGNDATPRQRVEHYLLYRAAELTLQQGYDWFTTIDRNTERKTDYYGDAFGDYYGEFGGGFFGGRFGYGYGGYGGFGRGFGGPFGGPFGGGFGYGDVREVREYTASSEILMGRGPKPVGDRRAFDARSVVDHLRGRVQYPGAKA